MAPLEGRDEKETGEETLPPRFLVTCGQCAGPTGRVAPGPLGPAELSVTTSRFHPSCPIRERLKCGWCDCRTEFCLIQLHKSGDTLFSCKCNCQSSVTATATGRRVVNSTVLDGKPQGGGEGWQELACSFCSGFLEQHRASPHPRKRSIAIGCTSDGVSE